MSRMREHSFLIPIAPITGEKTGYDAVHRFVRDFMFKHFHGCTFRTENLIYKDDKENSHIEKYYRYSVPLDFSANITPKIMAMEAARRVGLEWLCYCEGENVEIIEIKPLKAETEVKVG